MTIRPVPLFLAADHGGFRLKALFLAWLSEKGGDVRDLGTFSDERCDSLDYAIKMAEAIAANPSALGVVICKSGNGITMAANRYQAVRAALCLNSTMARMARAHNDANVLGLGAEMTGELVALDCLEAFLTTPFLEGRYAERRDRLTALGGLKPPPSSPLD